jgi:spore germination cell wall hydrolase CwlJ-like protein
MNEMLVRIGKIVASVTILLFGLILTYQPAPDDVDVSEIPEKVAKAVDPKQLACLAKNIFYEAGNESIQGQAAVARVVMNRVAYGFGKNPCNVVYQKTTIEDKVVCQFSWVCEGKGDPNMRSLKYKQAEQVAYDVLAYDSYTEVVPKSTLFFHNLTVDPSWPYRQVAKIGNHVFYSKAKKSVKPTQKTHD